MKQSFRTGAFFGITSTAILAAGALTGLVVSGQSKSAMMAVILTIGFSDAFADALSMHISQESEKKKTVKAIWESTAATFIAKCIFSMTLIIPMIFLRPFEALISCIAWITVALVLLSYIEAKRRNESVFAAISEHITVAVVVIVLSYVVGRIIEVVV
jgi:VIT1/CCC1 family predicted Fe2+/Mn2+ transporter